jgi:hypothetical protein
MYRSLYFTGFLLVTTLLLMVTLQYGLSSAETERNEMIPAKRELVRQLGLTDLAIWSEARYTRHPSQADFFTAFQDYPGAFDHFPAGSIISPRPLQDVSFLKVKKGQP